MFEIPLVHYLFPREFFPLTASSTQLRAFVSAWVSVDWLYVCVCVCVRVCVHACVRAHKTVFVSVLTCVHAFVDIIQNIQIPNPCKKEEKKERPFNLHSPIFFMPVTQEVPEKVDKNWQYWPCWATHVLLPRITAWLASPSSVLLSSWQHNTDTLAFKGNYPLPPPLPHTPQPSFHFTKSVHYMGESWKFSITWRAEMARPSWEAGEELKRFSETMASPGTKTNKHFHKIWRFSCCFDINVLICFCKHPGLSWDGAP